MNANAPGDAGGGGYGAGFVHIMETSYLKKCLARSQRVVGINPGQRVVFAGAMCDVCGAAQARRATRHAVPDATSAMRNRAYRHLVGVHAAHAARAHVTQRQEYGKDQKPWHGLAALCPKTWVATAPSAETFQFKTPAGLALAEFCSTAQSAVRSAGYDQPEDAQRDAHHARRKADDVRVSVSLDVTRREVAVCQRGRLSREGGAHSLHRSAEARRGRILFHLALFGRSFQCAPCRHPQNTLSQFAIFVITRSRCVRNDVSSVTRESGMQVSM